MGPFHVQRDFLGPTGVCRGLAALGIGLGESKSAAAGRGQAKLRAEGVQVGLDGWIVVGIDNADGDAGAVPGELIEAVGVPDLSRRVAGRRAAAGVMALWPGVELRLGHGRARIGAREQCSGLLLRIGGEQRSGRGYAAAYGSHGWSRGRNRGTSLISLTAADPGPGRCRPR